MEKENIKRRKSQIWKINIIYITNVYRIITYGNNCRISVRAMLPWSNDNSINCIKCTIHSKKLEIRKIRIILSVLLTFAVGYELCTNVIVAQKYMKPYKEDIQNRVQ